MKFKCIIVIVLMLLQTSLFSKSTYLLVYSKPPYPDTIRNYQIWLHKKDTTIILDPQPDNANLVYVYYYKFNTESHQIVCFNGSSKIRKMKDLLLHMTNYTTQMTLRGNCLVHQGKMYFNRPHYGFSEIEFQNGFPQKRIKYYNLENDFFSRKQLKIKSIIDYKTENKYTVYFYDTMGSVIRKHHHDGFYFEPFPKSPNNLLDNDIVLARFGNQDTFKNIRQELLKNGSLEILRDTLKNRFPFKPIIVKSLELKNGNCKFIRMEYNKYVVKDSVKNYHISTFNLNGSNTFHWKSTEAYAILQGNKMYEFDEISENKVEKQVFDYAGKFCFKVVIWKKNGKVYKETIVDECNKTLRTAYVKNKYYYSLKYTKDGYQKIKDIMRYHNSDLNLFDEY